MNTCPFCAFAAARVLVENDLALAVYDSFPLSNGHTLIVPRRHVASVFDLSEVEFEALWSMLKLARSRLRALHAPAAFNVGINDGNEAGQTVDHAHVHLIPRYVGDVPDPRGGVRWVLPARARYWTE